MSLLAGVRQGQQQGESLFIAGHFAQIHAQTSGQSQQQCPVAQVSAGCLSFIQSAIHSCRLTASRQSGCPQCCHHHGDRLTSGLSADQSLISRPPVVRQPVPDVIRLFFARFYFPMGRPNSKEQLESVLQRISNAFHQLANCQATREHFGPIAKVSQKWTIGVRFPAHPTGAGWTL